MRGHPKGGDTRFIPSPDFCEDEPVTSVERGTILHVARLARLALTDEEVERLGAQLGEILDAVTKVGELELDEVEPTSHPLDLVNVWADDEPEPSLRVEDALGNAPAREGDFFRVPPAG